MFLQLCIVLSWV